MNIEEVKVKSITEMVSYLVEKVDSISQFLENKKEVIEEPEEDINSLDGCVYKAKVIDKHNISMVKIGGVDELGVIDLYEIETYAPIVPCLYQPEFYYITQKIQSSNLSYRKESKPEYKKFTPKNINQLLITKDGVEYTTGYINENGVAIYYDQLPKDSNEEKIHKLNKGE